MQIDFRQTGGFGGLTKIAHLDTDQLPPQEADYVASLVADADFFHRLEPEGQTQPDRENYTVRVQAAMGDRTLHCGPGNLPAALQPLIQYLVKQAKYEKRSR